MSRWSLHPPGGWLIGEKPSGKAVFSTDFVWKAVLVFPWGVMCGVFSREQGEETTPTWPTRPQVQEEKQIDLHPIAPDKGAHE